MERNIFNENVLAVPKRYTSDAATKQSYFPSEMFCGSQDESLSSPANDVRCVSSTVWYVRNLELPGFLCQNGFFGLFLLIWVC